MAETQRVETEPASSGRINQLDVVAHLLVATMSATAELRVLRRLLAKQGIEIDETEYNNSFNAEMLKELESLASEPGDMGRMARLAREKLDAISDAS